MENVNVSIKETQQNRYPSLTHLEFKPHVISFGHNINPSCLGDLHHLGYLFGNPYLNRWLVAV